MFTTYNCNLLLQFQVFDNVSLAKRRHASLSRSIRKVLCFTLFFSLSHTHTHTYYSFSLSHSFSSYLSSNFVAILRGSSRVTGDGSGKSNRRLTASKNKPACVMYSNGCVYPGKGARGADGGCNAE